MKTMSYSAARANLAKTMEHVCSNHNPVIITRSNADSVVMMSLEDFDAIKETFYLMSNPKNAERLSESMQEIEGMISEKKKEQ